MYSTLEIKLHKKKLKVQAELLVVKDTFYISLGCLLFTIKPFFFKSLVCIFG
ncbi:hypothetical protein HanRHA438_Chr11g0480601 [Helianthus annuus]|nr:hypothetical protein HanRHA438_Chr11g0480601 [Helianthus annuus]